MNNETNILKTRENNIDVQYNDNENYIFLIIKLKIKIHHKSIKHTENDIV